MEKKRENIQTVVKDEINNQFKVFFSYKKLIFSIIGALFTAVTVGLGVYKTISADLDKKYASQSDTKAKFQVQENTNKNIDKGIQSLEKSLEDTKKELKEADKRQEDDLKVIIRELGTMNGKLENIRQNQRRR